MKNKNKQLKDTPSFAQIANSFELWGIYADPDGEDSEETFNGMSEEEKIGFLETLYHYEILDAQE